MALKAYWGRRIASSLLVLAVVLVLNFFLFRILPGDPVSAIVDPRFSPQAKEELAALFGLDRPMGEQFLLYVKQMLTFNFGVSFLSQRPVWDEIRSRLPNTLILLSSAMAISALLGIHLGVIAAAKRGGFIERLVLWAGAISFSFPSFFIQLVMLLLFAFAMPIFPLRGSVSIPPPPPGWPAMIDYIWHMVLPVSSLVILGFGSWALYVRNLMVKVLGEDFIFLARAKGLPQRLILWRHAFRSILPPIVTIIFLSLPGVVSGAVITETVFSLHGVGRFLLESVTGQDYPAAGAAFFLLALLTVISNLLADLAYGFVDPRIGIERKMER